MRTKSTKTAKPTKLSRAAADVSTPTTFIDKVSDFVSKIDWKEVTCSVVGLITGIVVAWLTIDVMFSMAAAMALPAFVYWLFISVAAIFAVYNGVFAAGLGVLSTAYVWDKAAEHLPATRMLINNSFTALKAKFA